MKKLLALLLFTAFAAPLQSADKTITDFTALTSAATGDELLIYDISASSPRTRKITVANLSLALTPAWSSITGKPTTLSGFGITDATPLDSDLTAIAALTTASYGRSLLTLADAAALRTLAGTVIGTDVQAQHADLSTFVNAALWSGANLTLSGAVTAAGLVTTNDLSISGTGKLLIFDGPSTYRQTGAGNAVFTITGNTALTLPTSGTLLTTTGNGSQLTNLDAGNIGSGTVNVNRGGTNIDTYVVGDLLVANAAASLARFPAVGAGNVLISQGTGVAPVMGKVTSAHVDATVLAANGSGAALTGITAAQIAFNPTGAGAIATTLDALERRVIRVKDFATGDGVTNDTAGVQAAITALEAQTTKTTLDFGDGTYLCSTLTTETTPQTSKRFLKLGTADLAGRDIVITGSGARIVFAAGTDFFTGLWALGKFRSLTVTRGLTFEKDSTVSTATTAEPNYRCLLLVSAFDTRTVEHVTIGAEFINGHQSLFIYGKGRNTRGKLKRFQLLPGVRMMNPYGPNIGSSPAPYGGGQQYICDPWVETEIAEGCLFDGGWDGAENATLNPTLRVKDGSTFTGAKLVNFNGNTLLHHGVEAIYPLQNWTILSTVEAAATVPAIGNPVTVTLNSTYSTTFVNGESVYVQTLGHFTVVSSTSTTVTLQNTDATPDAAMIGKIIYESATSPARAVVNNNNVDMTLPTGSNYTAAKYAIVSQTHLVATGNSIRGVQIGVQTISNSAGATGDATYEFAEHSVISGNRIEVASNAGLTPYAYGIENRVANAIISGNNITTPTAHKIGGIITTKPADIRGNTVFITGTVAANGYTSANRCVGVGTFGTTANGALFTGNRTSRLDVGVGPLVQSAADAATIFEHHDSTSVLPIDNNPVNLIYKTLSPPQFIAHNNGTTISVSDYNTAYHLLILSTLEQNTGSLYSTSTGLITIPYTGRYRFGCQVKFTGDVSMSTINELWLRDNGNDAKLATLFYRNSMIGNANPTFNGETEIYLTKGTVLKMMVTQFTGSAKNASGDADQTRLWGRYLP